MKGRNLFVKQPISAEGTGDGKNGLKRHLGSTQLTSIGIGAIIGAGIFVITGQAAANYAGPAVLLSFIVAAIICVFAGLCYAELAAMIPISGGAYSYSYVALGELPAWMIGWSSIVQYMAAASAVAIGWSGYFVSLLKDFGIYFSSAFTNAPVVYNAEIGWYLSGAYFNLPAAFLILVISILISVGIKAATTLNNIMVAVKLITIFLFIIFGAFYINSSNWIPFIPENTGTFGEFGWSGILRAAGLLFFAYNGFDTVATLAQETVNPQKNMPRGILGSLGVSTVAYIAMVLVLTGVASYSLLNVADPISVALNIMGPNFIWFATIVKFAILAALTSVVLAVLLAQTRVFFTMSKDGLLPERLSHVHPKFRTPTTSTAIIAVGAIIIAGLFPVDMLGQLVSLAVLIVFAIMCFGVLILRYTQPNAIRPFKVPLMPYIPLLGIACCLGQTLFLPLTTWAQFFVWMLIGLFVYFKFGLKHSHLRRKAKM
ncbi:MAG TPA: amino acid permease [Chlamydiales bacterium]|nr:amino acid permease [Chlamydiales bacterium]